MKKFNPEKELKKLKIKKYRKNYFTIALFFICIVVTAICTFYFTKSAYIKDTTFNIVNTKVSPFSLGDFVIASYIDGVSSTTIPAKNTGYKFEKVECDNGATATWNNDDWTVTTANLSKTNTKCSLYFNSATYTIKYYYSGSEVTEIPSKEDATFVNASCDNGATITFDTDSWTTPVVDMSRVSADNVCSVNFVPKFVDTIIANAGGVKGAISSITSTATTNLGIYTADDNDGTSYFFRGKPTTNNVLFANFCWKIVRINGNGSIRLIYNGSPSSGKCTNTTGTGTQIGTSAFKSSYSYNAYVGYMYGSTGHSTYANTHKNTSSSTIKQSVDNWYKNNLNSYTSYLDVNSGFCGDRRINTTSGQWWSYDTAKGYGTNATAYAPLSRFLDSSWSWLSTQNPTLKCSQSNDLYTTSNATQGNKALTYPVGLITADEVAFAGGKGGSSNSSYYLYTYQAYWSLSPFSFNGSLAFVFRVDSSGNLTYNRVDDSYGVRPVINIRSDVVFTGSGTSSDPYVIV